jgi:hypothetical protein
VKFVEGQGTGVAVSGQIGRESGDALGKFFGSGIEIGDQDPLVESGETAAS